jgi:hypothetical protein
MQKAKVRVGTLFMAAFQFGREDDLTTRGKRRNTKCSGWECECRDTDLST